MCELLPTTSLVNICCLEIPLIAGHVHILYNLSLVLGSLFTIAVGMRLLFPWHMEQQLMLRITLEQIQTSMM